MKKKIAGIICLIILFIACSKDKFQTRPILTLKSINSKIIPRPTDNAPGGNMDIEFEYTDKEGDIPNDTIVLIKVRNNEIVKETLRDTLYLTIPDFPKKDKGIIELNLEYQNYLISAADPNGPGDVAESDSLTMKFVLKDNASNSSDTLVINDIVIER